MNDQRPQAHGISRRGLLHRGGKLAYIAPVVIVAMKAEPAFATSGNHQYPKKKLLSLLSKEDD